MVSTVFPPLSDAAVLLVLLPPATAAPSPAALRALQHQLGPAVRVLPVDEASHPAVVHSFAVSALPACVLMRQGVELWRQPGLPDEASVTALLEAARPAKPPTASAAG